MQFALLGNHPDGVEMASALVESGRHHLALYSGPGLVEVVSRRFGPAVRLLGDVEEVLADPAVEAVIVAGSASSRPGQLRRALQSEHHVLCVHPANRTPDTGYEAAMIRDDTHKILLPILPDTLHPAIVRMTELLRGPEVPMGWVQLLEMERWSQGEVLIAGPAEDKPSFPGWDVLRALGGEVAEVSAYAAAEDVAATEPVLMSGRFETGGLFRASYLPGQPEDRLQFTALGSRGRLQLLFPIGTPGPAFLTWHDKTGELREEAWDIWDPWPVLVAVFEAAHVRTTEHARPSWQDEIRALELDDAARRGVERRRASALEYPDATEEAGFKGTMTLVGCGLLWGLLLLVIVANWYPMLFWATIPLVAIFLALQVLRWVVPRARPPAKGQTGDKP